MFVWRNGISHAGAWPFRVLGQNAYWQNAYWQNAYWTKRLLTKRLQDIMPTVTKRLLDIMPTGHNAYWTKCLPWQNAYRNTFRNVNKSEGLKGPTLGRHVSACATILACITLVCALVYYNFHRKVRLVSGRHVSACAPILRLRALLYLRVPHLRIG